MTPKAPDYGHQEADKELLALAKRLHISYRQARISLQEKIEKYLDQFEKMDAEKRALYDSGELSHEDFLKWRQQKIIDTEHWRNMLDQLSTDMTNQNKIAASMINDTLPEVYAINHNYGTYEAEVGSGYDTMYTLYDKHTAARLLKNTEYVLPTVNEPKDKKWNKQLVQSSVLQGILTGESMQDIAERFEKVVGMTESAAMRNARTAVTGAQNAGRIDSYIRAEKMGIAMKQVWMATLDGRVRDSHAVLDGEKRDVGKEFSNGCRYPGDPKGAPAEIYNCRCTLVAEVEGSDAYDPADMIARPSEYLKEHGMSYDEWKKMHQDSYNAKHDAETKTGYKEITTIEEAKKQLSNIFGSVEDKLWKNDENLMIRNVNQLMKLNERFGALTSRNVGYISNSPYGDAIAATISTFRKDIENTNLRLVNSFYKNPKNLIDSIKKDISSFFNMPCIEENYDIYTVTHEYGHILESFIARKLQDWSDIEVKISKLDPSKFDKIGKVYKDAETKHAKAIYEEIISIAKKNNPDFVIKDNLSRYGKTNYFEAFAEMFANSQCGSPNELGVAMEEWLINQGF